MGNVKIEVQDQFGAWRYYTHTSSNPPSIKQALQTALKTQMGQRSKKARAVDPKTGALLDLLQG